MKCPNCGRAETTSAGKRTVTYGENFTKSIEEVECPICGWKTEIPLTKYEGKERNFQDDMNEVIFMCLCGAKLEMETLSAETRKINNISCKVCGRAYDVSIFDDGHRRIALREPTHTFRLVKLTEDKERWLCKLCDKEIEGNTLKAVDDEAIRHWREAHKLEWDKFERGSYVWASDFLSKR
jgi:transcription elongation factor Elf1